jgi:hypothetical protein
MHARPGGGLLEHSQEQIFGLRVGYGTGRFALLAANTPFWMHKNSLHKVRLLVQADPWAVITDPS